MGRLTSADDVRGGLFAGYWAMPLTAGNAGKEVRLF
jgi:hypothetical protein